MLLRDGVRCHPKVLKAGAEAAWLWACCIDYSRQQLTDGFVPDEALPTLAACKSKLSDLTARLTAVGLLHREEAGFRVHDYLDHNDSAEKVKEDKRKDAERKRGGRPPESAPTPDGIQTESQRTLARARGVGVGNTPEGGSGGASIVPHQNRNIAFPWRVPIYGHLWAEWRTRLAAEQHKGDEHAAESALHHWAMRVVTEWGDKPTGGDDAFTFWRARFAEWRGSTRQSSGAVELPAPRLPKASEVNRAQGIPSRTAVAR